MRQDAKDISSFWLKQALKKEGNPMPRQLLNDISADICIVGGGYTGLWTAILTKEAAPEKKIVVIDQACCGYGASGSNGGCILTLSPKYLTLAKFYGEAEAHRLVRASEAAVTAIQGFVAKHGIACDLRVDGAMYMATNRAQKGGMVPVMKALDGLGLSSWHQVPLYRAKQFSGTQRVEEAFYTPMAGSVQPALLVRGMARVARQMGIEVYEQTPMKKIQKSAVPEVITPRGRIRAKKVVLAINAWMASAFKQFARSIAVVSSDMAITAPCPGLLEEIGLTHGASICDTRIFVHYYRTTGDGRLMMGKGGNTFAFGSRMQASFFQESRCLSQLLKAIRIFFPKLGMADLAGSWNGGSDRSVTGFPFFGCLDNHPAIVYGLGYSGNGVAQSYLGGQILCSLALGLDDEWANCGFTGGPRGYFPPEPVRWLGAMMVRNAIRRKEAAEDRGRPPFWIDTCLSGFARAAGKTDA